MNKIICIANQKGGVGKTTTAINLYHAMIGQVPLEQVIINTAIPHLDVVPSNQDLIGIEVEFVGLEDKEKRLRNLLSSLDRHYDFIVIDCPPSLGVMTVNALVASDYLIVPLQCEYFAMEGLGYLLNTVKLVKAQLNPKLVLGGILLTMFDQRNLLSHRVSDDVRKHFGDKVFKTVIPRNVRLSES